VIVRLTLACLLTAVAVAPLSAQQAAAPSDLKTLIADLGSLDYPVRTGAARRIRRAPAEEAVPALAAAVRNQATDEYARYRALVLLTSFGDRTTGEVVRDILKDKNDRLRQVAYEWLERHPDPALTTPLLDLLQVEQAEFVRPALIGALAALGDNPGVRRALTTEVGRGLDLFRSAVIDSLGEHHALYAVDAVASIAQTEGPLQDDAVVALGRIGDRRALTTLAALTDVPADVALTVRASRCLLGQECDAQIEALSGAVTPRAAGDTIHAAVAGLAAIAGGGNDAAMTALVGLAARGGAVRDEVAVGFAGMAVRRPERVVAWLDAAPPDARMVALMLLKDGFDALEEDFGEEQFYATARADYWKAADNSPTRTLIASIIDALEF
jgi:HEAT repeat protein